MKKTKFAYLFATTLVAGTMGLTSCQEEVENPAATGENTEVTIGLSVAPSTRATAGDVNLDGTNPIKNVAVVPFVGSAPQRSFFWETVNATTEPKKAQLNTGVNSFKVYGNLSAAQAAKAKDVYSLTNADFALATTSEITVSGQTFYAPHTQLYYFKNATQFYTATEGADWKTASYGALTNSVDGAKYIKIDDVNYAVGVLIAAVLNGDANNNCFYTNAAGTEDATNAAGAGVTVSGIVVSGQKDFTVDFATTGLAKNVYETAAKGAFVETANKVGTGNTEANKAANLYMIASPSATDNVSVNIEFNLPQGYFLKKTDGTTVIGSADKATKLYLGLQLTPKEGKNVFINDYVTYLNATVKNWGLASDKPVDVTDAEIGVEFDVTWEEGNIYDVEI